MLLLILQPRLLLIKRKSMLAAMNPRREPRHLPVSRPLPRSHYLPMMKPRHHPLMRLLRVLGNPQTNQRKLLQTATQTGGCVPQPCGATVPRPGWTLRWSALGLWPRMAHQNWTPGGAPGTSSNRRTAFSGPIRYSKSTALGLWSCHADEAGSQVPSGIALRLRLA